MASGSKRKRKLRPRPRRTSSRWGALTQDPIRNSDAFYDGIGVEPCTGTAEAPTAPPGVLCVYTTSVVNVAARTLANVITTDAARRRGFSALITSAAGPGEYGAVAVWSYTEPYPRGCRLDQPA